MKIGMDVPAKMSYLKPPDHRHHRSSSSDRGTPPRLSRHHHKTSSNSKKPSVNVQRLQDMLNTQFNSRDRIDFIDALNEYHAQRDIREFTQVLYDLFDTPAKRQMIPLLRKVIPQPDVPMFDQCMQRFFSSAYTSHTLPRSLQQTHERRPHLTLTHQFRSLPVRSKAVSQRSKSAPSSPLVVRRFENPLLASPVRAKNQPVKKVTLKSQSARHGWGFSIRGGLEHAIGIFVSYVDVNSIAERQGLVPGDQLVSVNDISFERITHGDAAKIIKAAKRLDLIVRSVGKVPGSFETRQKFTWVDVEGRPVSPPPDADQASQSDTAESRKSGFMLLNGIDERKVNVVVTDRESLGLSVRGGSEFGLGIYITGVDSNSVAENSGLKKGDQILDVNGQSFLDISHAEAAHILKHSKHLMMTIRDVGRMPYARMTYDHTQWLSSKPSSPASSARNSPVPGSSDSRDVFLRGAGSQLMLHSVANQHWILVDDLSRHLLNSNERKTMNYYLGEYQRGHITTEALVIALFELFNTTAKMSLMKEVRNLIGPRDIDKFDMLILKKEVDALKVNDSAAVAPSDRLSENSFDSVSSESHISTGSYRDSLDGSGSDNCTPYLLYRGPQHRHNRKSRTQKLKALANPANTVAHAGASHTHVAQDKKVIVEIHNTPISSQAQLNEEIKPPSDDSGVEMNSLHLEQQLSSRVTMSADRPVIINETIPEQTPVPSGERSGNSSRTSDIFYRHHSPQQRRQSLDSYNSDSSSQSVDSQRLRSKSEEQLDRASEFVLHNDTQLSNGIHNEARCTRIVTIHKTKPTLGVAIEGGARTRQPLPRIIKIQPSGSAFEATDLRVGQVIMEVNGRSLDGLQHNEAARAIAVAFKSKKSPTIQMLVCDPPNQ